ncbi:MAG: hypothetical protein RRZ24_02290 [Clostridia bacterium]
MTEKQLKRMGLFTRLSVCKDIVLAVGKFVVGIFTQSIFLFINSFFSVGMGLARFLCLKSIHQSRKVQCSCYRTVGVLVLISGLVYMLYSVRLFIVGSTTRYPMKIAIAIAVFTFTEIILNIKGSNTARKSKAPIPEAIRLTNLASNLTCLVLTQIAIISFFYTGDASHINGLTGIVFGGGAASIGVYMMLHTRWLDKHAHEIFENSPIVSLPNESKR